MRIESRAHQLMPELLERGRLRIKLRSNVPCGSGVSPAWKTGIGRNRETRCDDSSQEHRRNSTHAQDFTEIRRCVLVSRTNNIT